MNKYISDLLYRNESDSIDFKVTQYKFIGASKGEKAELLKDLLAFANSWRDSTAYILVGVKEENTPPHTVIGITDKRIDDATLQQFVNSKTNVPLRFKYEQFDYQSKTIGLISIPVQKRPIYLLENYAQMKKNSVYIRRGSSTAIARLEEISVMGQQANNSIRLPEPNLSFHYGEDAESKIEDGSSLSIDLFTANIDEIPNYSHSYGYSLGGNFVVEMGTPIPRKIYYKEFAKYLIQESEILLIKPLLKSAGGGLLTNVRFEVVFETDNDCIELAYSSAEPCIPKSHTRGLLGNISIFDTSSPYVMENSNKTCTINGNSLNLECRNLQADAKKYLDEFYLIVMDSCTVIVDITKYADQFDKAFKEEFSFRIIVNKQVLDNETILSEAAKYIRDK